MNAKGQMYDVATYGVISTVIVVYIHHIQVLMHVRNWTWWIVMWFCISFVFMPICCFIAQLGPYTNIGKKSIYSQLLPSMQLNAVILLIVGASCAPLLLHMWVERLLVWPRFYTNDN